MLLSSSRRPHRKTKTGCVICKRRKIKCDESKPTCKNCVHYGEECQYAPPKPRAAPSLSSNSSSIPNHVIENTSPPAPQSESPYSQHSDEPSNKRRRTDASLELVADLNMTHLQLLHHFTISTFDTMHHDPLIKILWRTTVVSLGYAHPYVMHGILAFSALHLAQVHPQQEEYYLALAVDHHQLGLGTATSVMLKVTSENCSALYIFSVLTFMFALANSRRDNDFVLVDQTGLSEWLILLRGSGHIVNFAETSLISGPISPIFLAGRRRYLERQSLVGLACAEVDELDKLVELVRKNTMDITSRDVYIATINDLRQAYRVFYTGPHKYMPETGDVFFWVFSVPTEFLVLLTSHEQEALVLMAYFAVVVQPLERDYWWLKGLSLHLMARIYQLLDDEHRLWVEWPLQTLGLGHETMEMFASSSWHGNQPASNDYERPRTLGAHGSSVNT